MAFRSKVYDCIRAMSFEQSPDESAISNVAVDEFVSGIGGNAVQIAKIARIGQKIQIDDACRSFSHALQDEVRADETGAPGHQNSILHVIQPYLGLRCKCRLKVVERVSRCSSGGDADYWRDFLGV
jgi:hypothetical protein